MSITIRAAYHAEYVRVLAESPVVPVGAIRKEHTRPCGKPLTYDHFPNQITTFNMWGSFATEAECLAFVSALPKYVGVVQYKRDTNRCALKATITFAADDVNKGKNEAGIKRVRKLIEVARAMGLEITIDSNALNCYKTIDEALSAL